MVTRLTNSVGYQKFYTDMAVKLPGEIGVIYIDKFRELRFSQTP